MNLIAHQFKTDWRHFRGGVLLLWGLYALQLLSAGVFMQVQVIESLSGLLLFIQLVYGMFLLARIIQSDALTGSAAQWLTRPLGRPRLVGAKSLFILVCLVLPRMIPPILVAVGHHYSFGLFLAALASHLLITLAVGLLLVALAALTPNLPRFVLVLGVGLAAFFICLSILQLVFHARNINQTESQFASAFAAGFMYLLACALFAWIWQVRPGRSSTGGLVLGSTVLVLPWIFSAWPADFLGSRTHPAPNDLAAIRQFFPPDTLWTDRRVYNGKIFLGVEVKEAARAPLRPGAWNLAPGKNLVIRSLTPAQDGIHVQVDEIQATPLLAAVEQSASGFNLGANNDFTLVLYQPDWGEADLLADNRTYSVQNDVLNGESRSAFQFVLPFPALQQRLTGLSLADYLDKARLCIFVATKPDGKGQRITQTDFFSPPDQARMAPGADDQTNMDLITRAVLPPSATAAQISDYVDLILQHLPWNYAQSSGKAWKATIQARLQSIGVRGLPALLARLPLETQTEDDFVFPVLTQLATRDQLPELREALGRDNYLANWFHKMKWDDDARDTLLSHLSDHRQTFCSQALCLAAAAKDPATYPDLKWHFVRLKYDQARVAAVLAQCPGFDLPAAVLEAWNRARLGLLQNQQGDLALLAAQQGQLDAFTQSVIYIESQLPYGNPAKWVQTNTVVLASLTDYSGPPETARSWLSANLARFHYDPAARRFRSTE